MSESPDESMAQLEYLLEGASRTLSRLQALTLDRPSASAGAWIALPRSC